MLHSRRHGDRQRGQILVLFELVLIVILGLAALVIDGGVLRNNRQILVNTLDAAALAGGSVLPVNGSADAPAANTLITKTIAADYPGLPTSTTAIATRCVVGVDPLISNCAYTIAYKCLVGVDPATNLAWVSRDVPAACDNRPSLGLGTALPSASIFTGAGPTRVGPCTPSAGDKCNVVLITGAATTQYKLAPVIGLSSGSTGTVVSAACNGPCGASPVVPVDLVVILDRTGSMTGNDSSGHNKITSLETAAKAVLGVYDPTKQRVALGLTGPSEVDASGNPLLDTCPSGGTAYGVADDSNFVPTTTLSGATTTVDTAATTVNDPKTYLGGPATTLSAAINNTVRTIPVVSKTGFPTTYPFNILVDTEQMQVTGAGTGTSFAVAARGSGVTHTINAPVSTPNYINNSVTTITVTSAAGFPTSGSYSIVIDSEQMLVTGGQGTTTWTVTRAQGGTTAAAHSSGETAILAVTSTSTALPVASAADG